MSSYFKSIEQAEIIWQDGVPYSPLFEDIYFSKESGLQEARHVFIDGNCLIPRWDALSQDGDSSFVIAETGFGSGLNFLVTWSLWKKNAPSSARLHYFSCELHPLSREDLCACLALWPTLREEAHELLDAYPILTPGFHTLSFEGGRVSLTLMLGDASSCYHELLVCGDSDLEASLREYTVDAWFLDGFSPAKNPTMWDASLFTTMRLLSSETTTVATFSVASRVKQGLESAGFLIKKQPGFGAKREMLIATPHEFSFSASIKVTPWHSARPTSHQKKQALVLGAGLAGCYTAASLARRGWQVTLLDAHEAVGLGASGNRQAILYPKLSPFSSPFTRFMLSAYLYAARVYQAMLSTEALGDLLGMLQLVSEDERMGSWLGAYPELAQWMSPESASEIAGVPLSMGGLFLPQSGWLDSLRLCEYLVAYERIEWIGKINISSIHYEGSEWHANDHHAPVLVMAMGYQTNEWLQTNALPITPVRGQMTCITSDLNSALLQVPVCGEVHVLPARNGTHMLGASYHPRDAVACCYDADDRSNLLKLHQLPMDVVWSPEITSHWSGVRAATPDYLPLVGPVPDVALFQEVFSGLSKDSNVWIGSAGPYLDGLYVCTGFGSRGLTTIPLSAESLAATITKEPNPLPRGMLQSLSPSRFLRRALVRKK